MFLVNDNLYGQGSQFLLSSKSIQAWYRTFTSHLDNVSIINDSIKKKKFLYKLRKKFVPGECHIVYTKIDLFIEWFYKNVRKSHLQEQFAWTTAFVIIFSKRQQRFWLIEY